MKKTSKGKRNKEILEGVNYSFDVIKRIKDNSEFTQKEKEEILHKFVGMSKDNNSYFTPYDICNFVVDLLDIKNGKVADLSGGIGNMIMPFIAEYDKLRDGVTFDLFEFDDNNSLAAQKAWEDYEQVNVYGSFNSIERHEEIPDNYDFIIGNPPFTGSLKYWAEWNHNKNGSAKNNNIADAFVDLSVKKVKDGGYIGLVLPVGHLYRGNATAKLRDWLKENVALKAVIPLNKDTFIDAGIKGTTVGTVLIVFQKSVMQQEIFMGDLVDTDDLVDEMKSMAYQFRLMKTGNYHIGYESDYQSGLHAKLIGEETRMIGLDKSIFFFSNKPKKDVEYNWPALRYINNFLDSKDEHETDHIQRFKFNYAIGKHWYIGDWDGLTGVNVYLDTVKKEYEKVKKPEETKWRDRVRKWYSGRFECNEDFYNVTFGFSQYDNEPYGEVYVSYEFLSSKSRKISKLVEGLINNEA